MSEHERERSRQDRKGRLSRRELLKMAVGHSGRIAGERRNGG